MGFVDLSDLPNDFAGCHGGLSPIAPDTHAIVQCASHLEADDIADDTMMFKKLQKHVGGFTGGRVSHLSLVLATVGAFVREVAVIPDIGGPPNGHLELLPRHKWRNIIAQWFNSSEEDDISDSTGEEEVDHTNNYADRSDDGSDASDVHSDVTEDDGSLGD